MKDETKLMIGAFLIIAGIFLILLADRLGG
jgi:hypothetical protein